MPNIIDVIIHTSKPPNSFQQVFVVTDEKPFLIYERRPGRLLFGEDDGFYGCYEYERPLKNWKAFGGRKFDIPLKYGELEHAYGQWWDTWKDGLTKEKTVSCGVATLRQLEKCYVFMQGRVGLKKLDAWAEKNEFSTDYYKYQH